jgi:hypothetical protein
MGRVPTIPQSFLVYGNPLMDFQGASVAPEAAALTLARHAQALQAPAFFIAVPRIVTGGNGREIPGLFLTLANQHRYHWFPKQVSIWKGPPKTQ